MRVNVQRVYEAWKKRKSLNLRSISTDGWTIYSYTTPIVQYDGKNSVRFNTKKYSPTTSTQQNSLRFLLERDGYTVKEMYGHEPPPE